jgi:hypothetical protein
MKSNLRNNMTFILLTLGILSIYCQKRDTIFYANKNIRSVEIQKNGEKVLEEFYSETGQNLLINNKFHYEYFDSIMQMPRMLDVENNKITQEFWTSNSDTIYNLAKFEPDFDKRITKFFRYISNNLVYPSEALEKHIEGKVKVSFIVDKNGMIKKIQPLTNIGYGLEIAAIELLNKYKKWGVLYLNSKPINCFFRLPIAYRLSSDKVNDIDKIEEIKK